MHLCNTQNENVYITSTAAAAAAATTTTTSTNNNNNNSSANRSQFSDISFNSILLHNSCSGDEE